MSAPSSGFKSYFFSCGRAMFGVAAFFWVYGLVISIWISWVAGSRHMTSQHDRATLEGMVIGVRQVVGFSLNQDNSINLESSGSAISQLLASLGPFIVLMWLVATAAGLLGLFVANRFHAVLTLICSALSIGGILALSDEFSLPRWVSLATAVLVALVALPMYVVVRRLSVKAESYLNQSVRKAVLGSSSSVGTASKKTP